MSNSLAYQERCRRHSAKAARGNLPDLARAIRTGHQAKLHEQLSGWREIEMRSGMVGAGEYLGIPGTTVRLPQRLNRNTMRQLRHGQVRFRMVSLCHLVFA